MAPSGPPAAKAKAEAPKPKAKPKAEKKPKEEGAEPEADKVPPPDRAAFEETMNKIQEAIDGFQKKQAAITVKIQARSGGKEEFFAQKAALRGQLDEFAGKIDTLMEKRNGINAQIGAKRAETQDAKQALGKMKKELGFKSESEIDDRIASIEFKMWTESVSLKDEKKYLQEISQLKRNRPKVSQVNRKEAELGAMAANPAQPLREQIPEINAEISALRDGKRQIQEKMSELMEQRKAQLGDLPEIIDQRDAIGKQIQGKIKERNEARDEYRKKEREYRKYQDVLRAERQKKFVEEREAKNKEYDIVRRQRAAEKLDDQPHVAEMTLIEQSMAFCKSLTAVKEEKKEEEKKEDVDPMSVEDICNTASGEALFSSFTFEDWALLTLRHEFQLMVASFLKDCGDAERVGIHESHILFYYSKYYKKQLNPKAYGKETLPELLALIADTVSLDDATKVLVLKSEGEPNPSHLVKLAEKARRDRQHRLDGGDEAVRLNFSLLKQILLAPPPPARPPQGAAPGGMGPMGGPYGKGGGKGPMGGKGKFQPKGYGKGYGKGY
mmetsp:Transcript_71289/g.153787  ORF Transcript_71289/g.153787 Transcript_71289/m.153787 type:complete len:554 (-) Transcript_71289:271-1932(-)